MKKKVLLIYIFCNFFLPTQANIKDNLILNLKKTPLNLILDKKFLVEKIYNLKEKKFNKTYINFIILENNNEINIFFDNKTFNLIGWQTKDIYQNINVTYFSSIQVNQKINKSLFKLPSQN